MCDLFNSSVNLTTNCNISKDEFISEIPFITQFQVALYTYILPLIVFIGLGGNVLAIYLIVADRQMRNVSSSIYLLSLLASDTGMLVSLLLVWLEALSYRLNHHPLVCRITPYWTYVFGYLSIWFVVCITVETFITICHPTKIKQMCTVFRARLVAVVLLISALSLYIVSPLITEVQPVFYAQLNGSMETCATIPKYKTFASAISYTDTILTLIAPFITIIILLSLITLAIIQSIRKKKKRSIRKTSGANSTSTSSLPQVRVAKMLFILSVSVVFLNLPSHVFRLRSMFMKKQILTEVGGLVHLILLFISYTSFSVKFFICVACSENFRKLFILHCCRRLSRYQAVNQVTQDTAV